MVGTSDTYLLMAFKAGVHMNLSEILGSLRRD